MPVGESIGHRGGQLVLEAASNWRLFSGFFKQLLLLGSTAKKEPGLVTPPQKHQLTRKLHSEEESSALLRVKRSPRLMDFPSRVTQRHITSVHPRDLSQERSGLCPQELTSEHLWPWRPSVGKVILSDPGSFQTFPDNPQDFSGSAFRAELRGKGLHMLRASQALPHRPSF